MQEEEKYLCIHCVEEFALNEMRSAPFDMPRTECKPCALKRIKEETHPMTNTIYQIKNRAKRNGIPFDLCVEDLNIPQYCPYLGIPIIKDGPRKNWPSVDRIIPALGYVASNVEIISYQANKMKNDASPEELKAFAQSILNRL